MGRLIYDRKSQDAIDSEFISPKSKLLLADALKISKETLDNIFIAIDIADTRYSNDYSVIVISEVVNDKITVLKSENETFYNSNIKEMIKTVIDKIELENGSIIQSIGNSNDNIRGQRRKIISID